MLEKIKQTKDQAKLEREERLENMKASFKAVGETRSLARDRVSILLVDDVYTSGATMQECCKVLEKAGFKNIWGFTLARTI